MSDDAIQRRMRDRLRRNPSTHSVPGSLPVLFFGDLYSSRVGTVGLNPSRQEYLDRHGNELQGPRRRFETLGSLGADSRSSLSNQQCEQAIQTMRAYFNPGKPVYGWFRGLDRVLQGVGARYDVGEAAHLDLVQEATDPTWSALQGLDREEAQSLLQADEDFLLWRITAFPLRAVICNGATVYKQVCRTLQAKNVTTGTLARVTWSVSWATVAGRDVAVAGWNIPLARPTGLGAEGERQLGQLLGHAIRDAAAHHCSS